MLVSAFAFQRGPFVDLLSPVGQHPLEHWDITHGTRIIASSDDGAKVKQYHRDIKGHCFKCHHSATRLQFPSRRTLASGGKIFLSHRFMVIQAHLPPNHNFSIELSIVDASKSHRRLIISTTIKSRKVSPMHTFVPLERTEALYRGWVTMIIDLESITYASYRHSFISCSGVALGGPGALIRRVFTARDVADQQDVGDRLDLFRNRVYDLPGDVTQDRVWINLNSELKNMEFGGGLTRKELQDSTYQQEDVIDESSKAAVPEKKRFVLSRPRSIILADANSSTRKVTMPKKKPVESVEIKPRVPKPPVPRQQPRPKKPVNPKLSVALSTSGLATTGNNQAPRDQAIQVEEESDGEDILELQRMIKGTGQLFSTTAKLLQELRVEVDEKLSHKPY